MQFLHDSKKLVIACRIYSSNYPDQFRNVMKQTVNDATIEDIFNPKFFEFVKFELLKNYNEARLEINKIFITTFKQVLNDDLINEYIPFTINPT